MAGLSSARRPFAARLVLPHDNRTTGRGRPGGQLFPGVREAPLKKTKVPFRLTDPLIAMIAAAVLAMVLLFSLVN
jgi:hypothetical protein